MRYPSGRLRFGVRRAQVQRPRGGSWIRRGKRQTAECGNIRRCVAVGDDGANVHWERRENEIGAGTREYHVGRKQRGQHLGRCGLRIADLAAIGGKDLAIDLPATGGDHCERRLASMGGAGGLGMNS